jgi:threonylcarbamoyladenosine tRNA methylthiotransferase MtaB
MKYSVVTFGCRVNQADSFALEGELRARGAVAAPPDEADIIIVNTCSVTAAADQGARQTIRRVVRSNPAVRVIVTGCYATRRPDEVMDLPNVLRVIPNTSKEQIVTLIAADEGLSSAERFGSGDGPCGAVLTPGAAGRTAFTIAVQTGCDEACSYCIIPATRGPGRSRPLERVAADIERAIAAGYKEVAITGVHLGSYGVDLTGSGSLTMLVDRLARWPADVLFRISSLEPMDCTPEIVALAAASPRIAPHFHLPLQHCSDDMLRAMRRPYTYDAYARLVHGIRRRIPHASLGTDVIVGFPGESDADFGKMRDRLNTLPLSHLHVFPYSDRPGTDASAFAPKVDGTVIRERGREVRAIGEALTRRFRASQAGATRRALTVDDGWAAVTDNYLKVRLERQYPRNEWVQVTIGPPEGGV